MAYRCLARALGRGRALSPLLIVLLTACSDPAGGSASDSSTPDAAAEADGEVEASGDDAAVALREVHLIDHKGWTNYPAELDPLPAHQPERLRCGIAGWFIENGSLEVDTGQCNYILVAHPAAYDVPKGSELEIEVAHFDLLAPEPATAHVALLFDADLQWETSVDVPGPGDLQYYRFRTTRDLAAGEPIRLHLHNHGQNTWLVGPVLAWIP